MITRRISTLAGCLSLFLLALGCDKQTSEVKQAHVSGTVKLDNKNLNAGTITFDPGNGEVSATIDIVDGKYEGQAPIGKNKVIISSFQKVSMKEKMKIDGPGYDEMTEINILPDRYNANSDITRDIVEGDNTFDFLDLKGR